MPNHVRRPRVKVMSDSASEKHAPAFEPSSYARCQSAVPSAFEPGAPPEFETHTDLERTRPFYLRTAPATDRAVLIFPADTVSRRPAEGHGMKIEIVQATRGGR